MSKKPEKNPARAATFKAIAGFCMLALASSSVADKRTYSCWADSHGDAHAFYLTLVDGKFDGFSYISASKYVHSCRFVASRHSARGEEDVWKDISADEAEVTLIRFGEKYAVISLKKINTGYKLELLSRAPDSCSAFGEIRDAVIVLPHKDKCRFPK